MAAAQLYRAGGNRARASSSVWMSQGKLESCAERLRASGLVTSPVSLLQDVDGLAHGSVSSMSLQAAAAALAAAAPGASGVDVGAPFDPDAVVLPGTHSRSCSDCPWRSR